MKLMPSLAPFLVPFLVLSLAVALSAPARAASAGSAGMPISPPIPEGLGVNIHFTDPRPGEMEMLAKGGFRWVRMDFGWGSTERTRGVYDFSPYDRLLKAIEPYHIRAILILDYSNDLYDKGLSPQTDEGRLAMAKWAAAAAVHFKGHGVLWEMYNEPNISFWRPKPDVTQYIPLALAVGKAIRQAAPREIYIGPAASTIDMPFLEACFKAGLLDYWSAVSVHPYRQKDPETAADDYRALRQLISIYAPKGKQIPIISGEWGYSSVWHEFDADRQAKMIARQWLTNIANDIPVSIWYDWHDDGMSTTDPEHHFGTVLNPYHPDRDPVYDPKPAYRAATTLTGALNGFVFSKRLMVGSPDDYVLLFGKLDDVRLAVWTTSKQPHPILIPASPGRFRITSYVGDQMPAVAADDRGLSITPADSPNYLAPELPNDLLRIAAAWQRAPLDIRRHAPANVDLTLRLKNPLSLDIRLQGSNTWVKPGEDMNYHVGIPVQRWPDPKQALIDLSVEGMGTLTQATWASATNPLVVSVLPATGTVLPMVIENPTGQAFDGKAHLVDLTGLDGIIASQNLHFAAGDRECHLSFDLIPQAIKEYSVGVRIEDRRKNTVLSMPACRYRIIDDFKGYAEGQAPPDYKLSPSGDPAVGSEQTVTVEAPADGPPAPGVRSLKITYHFNPGWKFIELMPQTTELKALPGKPSSLGFWLYGDGSGNKTTLRFVDAVGQTFQPAATPLTWKGWRYLVIPLDEERCGHWGGPETGVIQYPITLGDVFLLDSATKQTTGGVVYLADPTLIWNE